MMSTASAASTTLSSEQLAQFADLGYLVLPSFLPANLVERLKGEVDQWVSRGEPDDRYARPGAPARVKPKLQLELPEHGQLISHPPLMAMLAQILGDGFAHHHLHTARHDPGCGGVGWHHDYEQNPQTNRSHAMVHVFYYLNGLDGTIGDLLVLPRSQRIICDRYAIGQLVGTQDLPGTVVLDDLPPGSAVIVHSAVLHARRPKPGGEGRPRYFIDASYCQAGVRWPGWSMSMLARARELGLDRGGRHAHLFDPAHFYDTGAVMERFEPLNVGSLAPLLTE
jgi:hypothetical protein